MHVHHEPEFAIGYYRMGSRKLLPVRECPISAEVISRALTGSLGHRKRNPQRSGRGRVFLQPRRAATDDRAVGTGHVFGSGKEVSSGCGSPAVELPELVSVAVLDGRGLAKRLVNRLRLPNWMEAAVPLQLLGVFGESRSHTRLPDSTIASVPDRSSRRTAFSRRNWSHWRRQIVWQDGLRSLRRRRSVFVAAG